MEPAARDAANDAHDTPRDRQWALLAPYIVGWNAVGETTDGEEKGMAPPAENGPAVFGCVPVDLFVWMWGVVADGYIASGKARESLPPSTPIAGPQIVPLPASDERPAKRRRANS